jgi:general secretion pathway protein G
MATLNHGLSERGFTLIELLVVILILGLLAGIVGPRLFGHTDEAKQTKARVQIENLSSAVKMYKLDNGVFPTTEQGLDALVTMPQSGTIPKKWKKGGYLAKKQVPKDPWGNAYIFLSPGNHDDFDLISLGADGAQGGQDVNKDINSWEIE